MNALLKNQNVVWANGAVTKAVVRSRDVNGTTHYYVFDSECEVKHQLVSLMSKKLALWQVQRDASGKPKELPERS